MPVKSKVEISKNFVAFSLNMNFTYNKCVRQLAYLFLHLNLLFVPYFQWLLAITVIWRFFSLKALSFFLRNLPFDHEFGIGNAAVSVQIHFSEGPFIYHVSTWRGEGGQKILLIAYFHYYVLVVVTSSGILKAKQELDSTFDSDKLDSIDFTKFSKLTMCSA